MNERDVQIYRIKDEINNYFSGSKSFNSIYVSEVTNEYMKILNNKNYASLKLH